MIILRNPVVFSILYVLVYLLSDVSFLFVVLFVLSNMEFYRELIFADKQADKKSVIVPLIWYVIVYSIGLLVPQLFGREVLEQNFELLSAVVLVIIISIFYCLYMFFEYLKESKIYGNIRYIDILIVPLFLIKYRKLLKSKFS